MKTYYDLTRKEKKAYEKEFKKTPGGKELYRLSTWYIQIPALLIFLLYAIFILFVPNDVYNYDNIYSVLYLLVWVGIVVENVNTIYCRICFCSWLKNKYDIKRW